MASVSCITLASINKRADRIFPNLGYLERRREFGFLQAFLQTGLNIVPALNHAGECVSLTVKWKDICKPKSIDCKNSCDIDVQQDEHCITKTYPIENCFGTEDYGWKTNEYKCVRDVNSGELLSHTLEEAVAKTELEHDLFIVQDLIIPYIIGVVDSEVSAPAAANLPNNVSVDPVTGCVQVKPGQISGGSLYNIIRNLVKKNNITRPLLIIGNEALEDAFYNNLVTQESALLGRLFNEIPYYFDYDNIFSATGQEGIYIINLDAFAAYSWHESEANISDTGANLLNYIQGEKVWLRWHEESRFSSVIKLDKYQRKQCISDDHELIGRRLKAHFEMLVAPDGVCNDYPKVIKLCCVNPTPPVAPRVATKATTEAETKK